MTNYYDQTCIANRHYHQVKFFYLIGTSKHYKLYLVKQLLANLQDKIEFKKPTNREKLINFRQ